MARRWRFFAIAAERANEAHKGGRPARLRTLMRSSMGCNSFNERPTHKARAFRHASTQPTSMNYR